MTVGTTSAVQLFTSSDTYREVLIQNTDSTYYVHCGTFSAVTASTGTARFLVPPKPSAFFTNGTYNLYCLGEPSAGSAQIEIIGEIDFDNRDGSQ